MGDLRRDRSTGRGRRLAAITGAVALVAGVMAGTVTGLVVPAGADTQGPLTFESYALGSVNAQDGWSSTGPFDQAIVDNSTLPGAPVSFGSRSLRISDAVTSGSFGDQTFSKSTVDAAGEATADAGGFPTGTLQSRFSTSFRFASVTPGTEQVGMHTTVSPDRGDGARMSYVRIDDTPAGWNLVFFDYKDVAPHGTAGNLDDGCGTGDDFVETTIATGLSRTPHTLEIVMDFVPGGNNDIVKVYLDGARIKTGTSWEDYFRYCGESGGGTGGPLADQSRITRNVLFRESGTAHPANAGGGLLIDDFTVSTSAGPTSVVVDDSDLVPNGSWRLESPASSTGTYAFDDGPAPTPGGAGSLDLGIASGQHEWMNTYAYGACAADPTCAAPSGGTMTDLSAFHALDYSTYRTSGTVLPAFSMEIYATGVGAYSTISFIPDSALVANNTWQHWNTMDPTDGAWWSSRNLGGAFNCAPQSCSASWDQIRASFPNAKVVLGMGPNVGTGGTFTGSVDNFTVGLAGSTTIYDFERLECTTTCYADPVNGDDANSGLVGDPLQTIQAAVNKVQAGGTVELTSGTFTEDVVVTKSVDIHGQGASTIVHPGTSTPDCGSGSLCAGATNVFLVQANNVEISDLAIDGDNPSLTGELVGGADVDARNGIITNHALGTFNGLSVHDTTIENIFLRGIYASSGGSFTIADNSVDNVQGGPASIAIFNFEGGGVISGNDVSNANDAIASNWSEGTQFTNNTITGSGSGVHTDNAGANGGTADVISGNVITACTAGGYGIWAFVPYLAPTFSGNTVSGCDVGMAAFASCTLGGVNVCPGGVVPQVRFTGNDITGTPGGVGMYASTDSFGYGDGQVKVWVDHNSINGAEEGVVVEETGAATSRVDVSRNDLSGNTLSTMNNTGTTYVDARCNWWGQATGPAPGHSIGVVLRGPWLIDTNLDGNCIAIMKVGTSTQPVLEGSSGGTSQAVVTVTLDRGRWTSTSVQWYTADGTATAASGDYTAASGTLTFAPGQLSKTITIDVGADTTLEDYENFTLEFHSPNGALLPTTTKRIEIQNDEIPTLSVNNVSVVEGASAAFGLRLDQRYYQPITVTITSGNISAVAPGDYTAVPGGTTVTFPARTSNLSFSVLTKLDSLVEAAEQFRLTFTSPTLSNAPPRQATATIQANST